MANKGLLTLFLSFLSFISLKNIHFLGELIGILLSIIPNSAKNITKVNLQICFPNKGDQEIKFLTRESLKETTSDLLANLSPREAKVLKMRFGIDMSTDHTLEEVGRQFDVTR